MAGREAARLRTRELILDAVTSMADQWYDEVTLADVARTAGVSQQTVVNHFGSKLNLYLTAIGERFGPEAIRLRSSAVPGDARAIVDAVMADYEVTGDRTWRFIALAQRLEELQPVLRSGRRAHRDFLEEVFAPMLARRGSARRETELVSLSLLLDVTTWWQLRRAEGLSRKETSREVLRLVEAALGP
jgi:AcrR family transcriptional regulator